MTRALPPIAPYPRPGCDKATGVFRGGLFKGFRVQCVCGWTGPVCRTEKEAILAWNPRRDSAEAERRGAMAAVRWLEIDGLVATATAARLLTSAIDRGEVLPAVKTKARKRT